MLSLEIIGVLGALFAFLVYAMARTQLARRKAVSEQRIREATPKAAGETR
jgi:hypothetical protein